MANSSHADKINKSSIEQWNEWKEKTTEDIDLSQHTCTNCDWKKINLKRVNLTKANLSGTDLSDSILQATNFDQASLQKTKFVGSNLRGAILIRAILSDANLTGADLSGANLSNAKLRNTNLSNAVLSESTLTGAELTNCKINGVDFSNTKLSGAIIDESTIDSVENIKGAIVGVNGIGNKNSAALIPYNPSSAEVIDPDPIAIISSLERARKYFGYSVGMALLTMVLLIDKTASLEIEFLGIEVKRENFSLFAYMISLGAIFMTRMFMKDALQALRYIKTRKTAMQVGRFPWALTRNIGEVVYNKDTVNQSIKKEVSRERWISFFTRLTLSFHCVIYIILLCQIHFEKSLGFSSWISVGTMGALLLFLSFVIFRLSQEFQKPILHDPASYSE